MPDPIKSNVENKMRSRVGLLFASSYFIIMTCLVFFILPNSISLKVSRIPASSVAPISTIFPTPTPTSATILSGFSKDYYVDFVIDGDKKAYTKGWRTYLGEDVPYGSFNHMRPHAGGIYNYIDIHASLATDSNAFVNMWIKPGSESISNMTYDGWFAYRSSSYWFQGNCRFTIIENTGSQGNLRGIGTCDKLTDNKYDTQETKMISDLEFNIKMLGDISPVE